MTLFVTPIHYCPPRVGPEEASSANLLELDCMGIKEHQSFKSLMSINPICPQCGPYEASEGITPVTGNKNSGASIVCLSSP